MRDDETFTRGRLEEILNLVLCPVAGCWSLHGGHSKYYYDVDVESHVLEAWPVGFDVVEATRHMQRGLPLWL